MKKLLALFFSVLMLLVFAGCSDSASDNTQNDSSEKESVVSTESTNEETSSDIQSQPEVDLSFKAPAEIYPDPEDANLSFTFDDSGRVTSCTYSYNGERIVSSYSYKDNQLNIYSFKGDMLVDDKSIVLNGEFDANVGYTNFDGFYVKGYTK